MERNRSIEFSFIGLGQGGGRIAAEFSNRYSYTSVAINTASVDLEKLPLSTKSKLHLDYGLDGAGRDIKLGQSAFEGNREKTLDFLRLRIPKESNYHIVCVGGGGGTGSGGLVPVIEVLKELRKPIGVIYTLPLESEDTATRKNCITAIRNLMADKEISPVVFIDNAKIAKKYPNLSIVELWPVANYDIARSFHIFNMLTAKSSDIHSFDMTDYMMTLRAGGCMTMGEIAVSNYHGGEDLAKSIRESIGTGLLSEGFDLSTARRMAIVLRGSPKAMARIKAVDLDYAFEYIKENIKAGSIYRGVYSVDVKDDQLRIHSLFGGLDLPRGRLEPMIEETNTELGIVAKKRSMDFGLSEPHTEDTTFKDEDDPLLSFIREKVSKGK